MKQNTLWVGCIGTEGQRGKLRLYVATITVNLWNNELLQQWNTQINIPAIPETHVSGKDTIKHYKKWSPAIQAV